MKFLSFASDLNGRSRLPARSALLLRSVVHWTTAPFITITRNELRYSVKQNENIKNNSHT